MPLTTMAKSYKHGHDRQGKGPQPADGGTEEGLSPPFQEVRRSGDQPPGGCLSRRRREQPINLLEGPDPTPIDTSAGDAFRRPQSTRPALDGTKRPPGDSLIGTFINGNRAMKRVA
jgi:hypothetical protein